MPSYSAGHFKHIVPPRKDARLELALDHAQKIFLYRAGQRWSSIKSSLTTYGFLATAAVTATKFDLVKTAISLWFAAAVSALLFWMLDIRNVWLIDICIERMKEIERKMQLSEFQVFSQQKQKTRRKGSKKRQYRFFWNTSFRSWCCLRLSDLLSYLQYGNSLRGGTLCGFIGIIPVLYLGLAVAGGSISFLCCSKPTTGAKNAVNTEIRTVIFDCDGTLVDSEKIALTVLAQYATELGASLSADDALFHYSGVKLDVVFAELEKRSSKPFPVDFLEVYRKRQLEALGKSVVAIPGAEDMLKNLKLPYCIASNAPRNKVDLSLKTTGLDSYFEPRRIFSAYETGAWKPKPDLFFDAARGMNVEPQECIVVEDSRTGIDAGVAAGMTVFAFDPHGKLSTLPEGVTVFRSLDQILGAIHVSAEK